MPLFNLYIGSHNLIPVKHGGLIRILCPHTFTKYCMNQDARLVREAAMVRVHYNVACENYYCSPNVKDTVIRSSSPYAIFHSK